MAGSGDVAARHRGVENFAGHPLQIKDGEPGQAPVDIADDALIRGAADFAVTASELAG